MTKPETHETIPARPEGGDVETEAPPPPSGRESQAFEEGDGLVTSHPLTITRIGEGTYVAHTRSGAELRIAREEDPAGFTPGELLKLALAACNAMSADARLVHALGADFPSQTTVETLKHEEEERYAQFRVTVVAPVQDLGEEEREKLEERAAAAVKKNCTVGRTLGAGATYEFRLAGDGE
ncbi:MAG: OsmC family protein [bacterium]|nr:OsmC family protein [bacterium]